MSKAVKAVGNAITSVVKGVVKAVTSVVKAVVNVVSSVVNFVAQPFMGLLGGTPDIPNSAQEAERQQGVLIQQQGSNVNIPVIYGYRKVGGIISFAETGSTNNKYLWVAYVLSEGLVEGLREVFIDDYQLPSTIIAGLNSGQEVDVTTDKYKDRIKMRWYPGVYFSNPASSPVGAQVQSGVFNGSPSWKTSMHYNGLATLFVRYEWKDIKTQEEADSNPFGGNIPIVQAGVLGRRIASLLVDAENNSYDSAPVRYSTNPAEILLDYLRNPRYGKGLLNDDIHWDSWKKAARKCNQTVTYITGVTGPILTTNYVLETGANIFSNVKTLLMGFRAYMPYIQGKYKLKIEDAGNDNDITSGVATIVATFNKDNIVGDVTYTGIEKSAKYNVVSIGYVDPDQKFSVQQVIYPESEAERQTYIDKDGGRENKLDATFPTITNYAIAKDMARLLFNKSRRQETCSLTVTSQGLELEPGDNIRIQSNILNFGTDPWRVVSVRINDNMTVELGCVRNPDDIYPHSRVGEEDIVLPPYIPKGSIIYFPGSSNSSLLGLVPPTKAVTTTGYTGSSTNPTSTNPAGNGGGGVGGGTTTSGPAGTTTTVVSDVNSTPVTPPPPPPFDAKIVIRTSKIKDWGNGTFSFELNLTQPDSALYDFSLVWWRANIYSPWVEIKLEGKPGIGGDIPLTIGPLPRGLFDFYIRCFATDGRASTQVVSGQLASRFDILQLNPSFSGLTGTNTTTASEGWAPPASSIPAEAYYQDDIDRLEITPQLSGGFPLATRSLKVRIQQIENVIAKPLNFNIGGFTIYYKLSSDIYYSYENFDFPGSYTPGQVLDFNLAGDFGGRAYPSAIIAGTNTNTLQYYNFVVRLRYRDNHVAEKQLSKATGPVENFNGFYNYIVYGNTTGDTTGNLNVAGNCRMEAVTSAFNTSFQTVDQAPPGAIVNGLAIVPSIDRIFASFAGQSLGNNLLRFSFNPPSNSKFRGYKIRYRPVIAGANPAFFEAVSGAVADVDGKVYFNINSNYTHTTKFDWVITAQVSSATGIVDATNSLVARVTVLNNDPEYQNLYTKFNFQEKNTAEAIGGLRTTFDASPVVNVRSWNKHIYRAYDSYNYSDVEVTGSYMTTNSFYLNTYYRLRFQLPTTATAIICYRRHYWASAVAAGTSTSAPYYGIGPWERVRVAKASMTADGDGWFNLNFRGPIAPTYFNLRHIVQAGVPLVDGIYGAAGVWPYTGSIRTVSGVYPYAGDLNGSAAFGSNGNSYEHQYLFVIEDENVELNKGLMLEDFFTANTAGGPTQLPEQKWAAVKEGFVVGNLNTDRVINDIVAEFNTPITAGYGRKLSDAITSPAFNKLTGITSSFRFPAQPKDSGGFPLIGQQFSQFLNQPRDGQTVI